MKEISVIEFSNIRQKSGSQGPQVVLLDVRSIGEFSHANIGGVNIPLDELGERLTELNKNKDKEIYCLCHHGIRSYHACLFLQAQGFKHVINISGGLHAWSHEVDPSIPVY